MERAQILNEDQNAFLLCNSKGVITHVNLACLHLFGYEKHEMIGELVELLVPDYAKKKHPALREQYMKSPVHKNRGTRMGLKGQRKNGSVFDADVTLLPLYTIDDSTAVIAIIRDISDPENILSELKNKIERLKPKEA